jgi:pimeloyl-ACP methyl ester carboxylesterase
MSAANPRGCYSQNSTTREHAEVTWLWVSLAVLGTVAVVLGALHLNTVHRYMPVVVRIFQEKPLFILPFGQPVAGAEDVTLTTPDGQLQLQACYLRTPATRKGVVLFGLEFGSNRWGCVPYCEFLREQGYDIFTFEMRGQGNSPAQAGYEPLQWVTDYEVIDFQTALAYLKSRPDRHPNGAGFFGLSKGAGAGLMVAAHDPFIRCCVTDGAFGTFTTMMPYVKQWMFIYIRQRWAAKLLPHWYLRMFAKMAIRRVEAERGCHYPGLERALTKLAPRPLFMIHGGADNYIKPDMARALFDRAGEPRDFWLVEGAKHNQAMNVANGEYQRRVLAFFDTHLAAPAAAAA